MNHTLTAVSGLRVGHATVPGGGSGCTVVLGPFRAAVEVRGMATGSRELGVLAPEHLVPRADALLLTGGSAFGLAAADGVTAWLADRGMGYETRTAPVPIVPGAVIYDLAEGRERPGAETGRQACDSAHDGPVETGRVGAGTGATVGKLLGPERGSPGGLGSAALEAAGGWTVGALAVVNALGNVVDGAGRVVAGVRDGKGGWVDAEDALRAAPAGEMTELDREAAEGGTGGDAGTHTTLAVVATNAPLGRLDLLRLARMASTALARRIDPVHTPFDGDVVFAVSTAAEPPPAGSATGSAVPASPAGSGPESPPKPAPRSAELMVLGVLARRALEEAILGAVRNGPAT